jgi:hypothetical protein
MREIGSGKIMLMMIVIVIMVKMMMMVMIVIVIMVKIMVIMTGSFYNHLSKICTSINTIIIDLLLLSTSPIINLQLLLLLLIMVGFNIVSMSCFKLVHPLSMLEGH